MEWNNTPIFIDLNDFKLLILIKFLVTQSFSIRNEYLIISTLLLLWEHRFLT